MQVFAGVIILLPYLILNFLQLHERDIDKCVDCQLSLALHQVTGFISCKDVEPVTTFLSLNKENPLSSDILFFLLEAIKAY